MDDNRNPILDGNPPRPLLVVISGPSGVGKDSILMRMREANFPFHFVVTATSRPMRDGERDGFDYHFVTHERFEAMIAQEELLEWAEVYGQYKGVPKHEVRRGLDSGLDVILRIDIQGAATIKRLVPEAVFVFMMPGNIEELRLRLHGRGTEAPEQMERRLGLALKEMEAIEQFDYLVLNGQGQLDDAVEQIRAIIRAEKHRVRPRKVEL